MVAIIVARRYRREQRAHGRRERIFPHILIYLEFQKNTLSEHIIYQVMLFFYLLQEIKDDLDPATRRSHAIPALSKLLAHFIFLPFHSFQRTVASLFLYSLFMTTLICAPLGILRWLICKLDVASAFFNLCIC